MDTTTGTRPQRPPRQKWRQRQWAKVEIIAAAHRWEQQTGRTARYIEWQPLERAQERGFPLAGPTKWTDEFPSWPGSDHVQRVFGSWRHFYVEAAIAGRPPIELSYHDRVTIALALKAERWTWDQVGEHLQLSRDTVRRYINAQHCPGCGCYIAERATACHACRTRQSLWGERYSRDEILTALREWHDLEGDFPVSSDWRLPGHPRWLKDCPRFPPTSAVFDEFGTWNDALLQAGRSEPHRRYYSNPEILDEMREFAQERGMAPTTSTWDRRPIYMTICDRFGTWNDALLEAGLEPLVIRPDWTEDAVILAGLRALAKHLGRLPTKNGRVGWIGEFPSPILCGQRFDGFADALRLAGLLPTCPKCGAAGATQCVDADAGGERRHPHPSRRVAGGTSRPHKYKRRAR